MEHKLLVGNSRNTKRSIQPHCLAVVHETHLQAEPLRFYLVQARELGVATVQLTKR